MLDKELKESYDIVNTNSTKVAKLTKLFVYNFLYVRRRIFKFYSCDVKLFFALISNKEKLISILNCY